VFQLWIMEGTEYEPLENDYHQSYLLVNYGALVVDGAADCLDANSDQMYDGGAIIQWGCNSNDPYQLWNTIWPVDDPINTSVSGYVFMNVASIS
jgi:hypothetical protein